MDANDSFDAAEVEAFCGAMDRKANRLRILLSAYFFSPDAGSEMGTGWNAAIGLARSHEVWVVTTGQAQDRIDRALAASGPPYPTMIYHDLPQIIRRLLSANEIAQHLRYYLWQLAIFPVVQRVHRQVVFDLTHHLTPAKYWAPSSVAWLDAPFVWGPVGAAGSVRPSLWRNLGMRGLALDLARKLGQATARLDPATRATGSRSAIALAADNNTASLCRALGARKVAPLSAIALPEHELARLLSNPVVTPGRPFIFASFQRLVYWKGVHLGLEAFARLNHPDTLYYVVGDGPEKERLTAMAHRLGVVDRVIFHGAVRRDTYFDMLLQTHAVVYPSLHPVSAWTVMEAMAAGKPVICLADAGDSVPVSGTTGFIVEGSTEREVVAGLAEAMGTLVAQPELHMALGERAQTVARSFGWTDRIRLLNRLYLDFAGEYRSKAGAAPPARPF